MRFVAALAALMLFGVVVATGGAFYVLWHFGRGLPEYGQLADYEPAVVTRVHAGDGRLMAEYATEKRVFVPLDAIPKRVVKAFMAAEDKNFYSHPGVDVFALMRAVAQNVTRMATSPGRRPIGASTITQQVARNFLLTDELSLDRKIKEAILAFRIEQVLSKDRILELYLNEINLGFRAYGVGAAALNYFDKSLDDLTLGEAAYLAALPKAPNRYNPLRNLAAAQGRRDWVLDQMVEAGYAKPEEAAAAKAEPIQVRRRDDEDMVRGADYFAEEVRRELIQRYGEKMVYAGGLSVRTTLDPRLQALADRSLRDGLIAYDRRHGWRGPVQRTETGAGWEQRLAAIPVPAGTSDWRLALVLSSTREAAQIGFTDGAKGTVPLAELKWARETKPEQKLGPAIERADQVLKAGDVVLVEPTANANSFALRQVPAIGGALVALDPHTGRVLAMSGGWSFEGSQFNRATQAMRQPGSSFKPFVYMAALDHGYTPSTIVLDSPVTVPQGPGLPDWRPRNYSGDSLGPVPMRVGIEKSRNQMTVRIGLDIGINVVADYAAAFGENPNLPRHMSMVLGAGETTVLRHTAAYGMIVNGGKKITPTLIDRIDDRNGKTLYRHDQRACTNCGGTWQGQAAPVIPDTRPQIEDPLTAYQMVSMLQGVVERGTGVSIKELGRPLAGKTGTSNDANDTWFMGFSPDLTVGIFVGFDQPKSLGDRETGSSVCVPIFKEFMGEALKDTPKTPFRIPQGIRLVRTNPETGKLARAGERTILDAFRPGSEPTTSETSEINDSGSAGGGVMPVPASVSPASGSGGIY